jgi:hypothetical protein
MTDDVKQERDELATALRMTAKSCADHLNTILRLRAELEAFKQEVSDVVYKSLMSIVKGCAADAAGDLSRFIIPKPKPDPLVEVFDHLDWDRSLADKFSAALEARNLKIVEASHEGR